MWVPACRDSGSHISSVLKASFFKQMQFKTAPMLLTEPVHHRACGVTVLKVTNHIRTSIPLAAPLCDGNWYYTKVPSLKLSPHLLNPSGLIFRGQIAFSTKLIKSCSKAHNYISNCSNQYFNINKHCNTWQAQKPNCEHHSEGGRISRTVFLKIYTQTKGQSLIPSPCYLKEDCTLPFLCMNISYTCLLIMLWWPLKRAAEIIRNSRIKQ